MSLTLKRDREVCCRDYDCVVTGCGVNYGILNRINAQKNERSVAFQHSELCFILGISATVYIHGIIHLDNKVKFKKPRNNCRLV